MPFGAPPGGEQMNGHAPCFRALLARFRFSLIFNSVILIISLATAAPAQDLDDVSFAGVVADSMGAVIPGAGVTARRVATGAVRAATTDGEGRYRLVELPPGAYTLRAARAGFAAAERRDVLTLAGQSARIDFTLRPAALAAEQTVVSDADAPVIDTTRTVAGGAVAREELERLPVFSRSPLDFLFLLGGVTEEPLSTRDAAEDRDNSGHARRAAEAPEEAGTFALAGGAAYSNNVTIDGLDDNDDRAARERFRPPLDAVEEVQVVTNQFSAEYGRASGGRVNLRTRPGSNSLRGRLSYFFKDESLNANTWNNNRRGLKRLPLQEHRPSFSLGGPVRLPALYDGRGRTLFFIAYEREHVLDSTLIDVLVPVEQNGSFPLPRPTTLTGRRFEPGATPPNPPAELAPFVERVSTPLRSTAFTARLDHDYSEGHSGAFLFQLGRSENLRQFGGGSRLADGLQGRRRDTDGLAYTDNLVLTPSTVNQLRAQVARLGGGVFYSRALLRTLDDFTLGRSVVEFDTDDLPAPARRAFVEANLRFPHTLAADSPLVRDFGARLTDFSRRLDPTLKIPESYQANAGFERELGRGFVVEANYTFNRGLHLWREFNANAPRLPPGF